MTTFEDMKPFFDLMLKEMQRHDSEQGDSWKSNSDKMDRRLDRLIRWAVDTYFYRHDPSQLEDIANLCAMRRLRSLPYFGRRLEK